MIEWDRVAELRDEVGAEDFAEVVELFLDEVEATLARIGADPALDQLERDLHFIKGSALNLGFSELAALCLKGERSARSGHAEAIELPLIAETFRVSRSVFLDGLGPGTDARLVG